MYSKLEEMKHLFKSTVEYLKLRGNSGNAEDLLNHACLFQRMRRISVIMHSLVKTSVVLKCTALNSVKLSNIHIDFHFIGI